MDDAAHRTPPGRDGTAGYVVRPVPRSRQVVLDALTGAARRFPVHGLVEFDVGQASDRLAESEPPVSWTGFVIATVARPVAQHPEVNARRVGNRMLFFDRVDVGATVERDTGAGVVLGAVTIGDADQKSCAAISGELRRAKHTPDPTPARRSVAAQVARLPGPRPPKRHVACRCQAPGRGTVRACRGRHLAGGCSPRAGVGASRSRR